MTHTHTPGPWQVTEYLFNDCLAIVDARGQRIAVLPHSCPQSGTTKASNANVIAAAPEMLAALEDAVDVLKEAMNMEEIDSEGMVTEILGEVINALRKARGEA